MYSSSPSNTMRLVLTTPSYSGTKLNIDYFLEEIMDEENLDDIYSYFKNSDTDNLDIAMNELGADYSEEEVRLVRVKFISEMAN